MGVRLFFFLSECVWGGANCGEDGGKQRIYIHIPVYIYEWSVKKVECDFGEKKEEASASANYICIYIIIYTGI